MGRDIYIRAVCKRDDDYVTYRDYEEHFCGRNDATNAVAQFLNRLGTEVLTLKDMDGDALKTLLSDLVRLIDNDEVIYHNLAYKRNLAEEAAQHAPSLEAFLEFVHYIEDIDTQMAEMPMDAQDIHRALQRCMSEVKTHRWSDDDLALQIEISE